MGGYLSIPILTVVVLVQAVLAPELRLWGGAPDFVLMFVLAYSLLAGFERGVVWALVGGILHDLISAVPMGTTALALVATCAAAGYVLGKLPTRSLIYPPLAAGVGTFIMHGITLVILSLTGRPLNILQTALYVTVPTTIYNGVLMAGVYWLVGRFFNSARTRRVASLHR
jgi:rod shape-determining protein MreD